MRLDEAIHYLRANDPSIKRITLGSNDINAADAGRLADALRTNTNTISLTIYNSKIGNEGARHLADALETNKTVEFLLLMESEIGDEGAMHLANALTTNNTIKFLSLGSNKIGNTGAIYLANALKTNYSVETLDLKSNHIGVPGAKALADTLKGSTTVDMLDLANNEIGNEGARYFAEALKTNSTAAILDFTGNGITRDGLEYLAEALKENTRVILISSDDYTDEACASLANRIKIKQALNNANHSSLQELLDDALGEIGYYRQGLFRNSTVLDNAVLTAMLLASKLPASVTLQTLCMRDQHSTYAVFYDNQKSVSSTVRLSHREPSPTSGLNVIFSRCTIS